MNARFEWQDEYNIGVEQIDKEHQRLFKIINKLFTFKDEEKDSQWTCQEGIKYFKSHAIKHFSDEEAYMASIGYEGLAQHQQIHRGFRENTLPALEQELMRTNYALDAVDHFLGVCAGWLIGHTLTEDLAITGKHGRKWERLLPGEEQEAMKNVIAQLVFDMFQLEPQLISSAYSGEKFGTGVYYRLVYGTPKDEMEQEIILVFEEKLLVNTVGKILGAKTNKLDSMLVHASRYTAQQFVGRVLEHLPAAEHYSLKEEDLLSFEQFRRILMQEKLQISLLFNTGGAGYFAYCAIAPHLMEQGIATPIGHENALSEVEKYLTNRRKEAEQDKARHKPKILVVDDSATIRKSMENLLGGDYDVSAVESGVAAIRAITLNQPDLVLLDYEMPVVNGKQTLEMLRLEQAFAQIPVFFLTGRDDPEVVRELLALRPAGYLLKYLKPADLKSKIDAFFEKQNA